MKPLRTSSDAPDFDQAADLTYDQAPTYDEATDPDYDDLADPDYDEGSQGEFADDFTNDGPGEEPSQEYYKHS